jgi:signal transduction histidine kinase/CheY-like chemotaxis protein
MSELAPLVIAQFGVFYVTQREADEPMLDLVASYGAENPEQLKQHFALREGLIGQAASDKRPIRLSKVPGDYIRIGSGLGSSPPANVNILPALFEDEVKAVIELASFEEFNETHHSFLNQLMETVGIVLNTIAATMRTEELLKESQLLTQELQTRQSELTTKQEELHNTNEELQEKAQLLENEKRQVEAKNFEIEMARRAVEEKAEQLALTSQYKSEFFANMSHELRTPLNSLLILSKLLADNQQGNLNEKQIEFARTINSAGTDLLSLINDILDLSKIESGTVTIEVGETPLAHLRQHMERTFRQIAADKGLAFSIKLDSHLPETVRTDEKRLQQVVLNLLSNAFKFTASGQVTLDFHVERALLPGDTRTTDALAIAVTDTGIGIPEDKQKLIFEAFQQADGTTSRKFGGTGLGLSISREIARLLGGELRVESTVGKGSTFTLVVPFVSQSPALRPAIAETTDPDAGELSGEPIIAFADDRDSVEPGDRVVLIVEDDQTFGEILLGVAREAGLKGVLSNAGSGTLALARKLVPDAITLDLGLADIDGWVLFDLLRHDPKTKEIPIPVVSGAERVESLSYRGAASVLHKPVSAEHLAAVFADIRATHSRAKRNVLVADTDPDRRIATVEAIRDGLTAVTSLARLPANTDEQSLAQYDAIVLGLTRSTKENNLIIADLLAHIGDEAEKLIVLSPNADTYRSIVGRSARLSGARSAESIDQVASLIGRVLPGGGVADAAEATDSRPPAGNLAGSKVLIIDDDIRNIYSLTSVLETYGIEVLHAERGRDGIALLEQWPDIDVALIDIMMPEMDGYETMRTIRQRLGLADLPIISVTAKAMKGDRQKCLAAGASDYIAKPVDLDLLMALLRVWVGRSRERQTAAVHDDALAAAK